MNSECNTPSDAAVKAALTAWLSEEVTGINLVEDMRYVLAAAIPYLQLGHGVKQLEWVDTGQRGLLETSYFAISGTLKHTCSPWGKDDGPFPEHYAISFREHEPRPWELRYWVGNNGLSGLSGSFATLEDAKAAAQADFERRVRECIVGGVDVAAVREQALEEAAVLCEISVKVSQEQLDREQDRAVRAALRGEVAASNVLAKRIRALSAQPAQTGDKEALNNG